MPEYHALTHIGGVLIATVWTTLVVLSIHAARALRIHLRAETAARMRGTPITAVFAGHSLPTLLRLAVLACTATAAIGQVWALTAAWLVLPEGDAGLRYVSPAKPPAEEFEPYSSRGKLCVACAKLGPPLYIVVKAFAYLFFFLKSRTVRPTERMSPFHRLILSSTLGIFPASLFSVYLINGSRSFLDGSCEFRLPLWGLAAMWSTDMCLSSLYLWMFLSPLRAIIKANKEMHARMYAAASTVHPLPPSTQQQPQSPQPAQQQLQYPQQTPPSPSVPRAFLPATGGGDSPVLAPSVHAAPIAVRARSDGAPLARGVTFVQPAGAAAAAATAAASKAATPAASVAPSPSPSPPPLPVTVTPAAGAGAAAAATFTLPPSLVAQARSAALEVVMRKNALSCVIAVFCTTCSLGFMTVSHIYADAHTNMTEGVISLQAEKLLKMNWSVGVLDIGITCVSIYLLMHSGTGGMSGGTTTAGGTGMTAAHHRAGTHHGAGPAVHSTTAPGGGGGVGSQRNTGGPLPLAVMERIGTTAAAAAAGVGAGAGAGTGAGAAAGTAVELAFAPRSPSKPSKKKPMLPHASSATVPGTAVTTPTASGGVGGARASGGGVGGLLMNGSGSGGANGSPSANALRVSPSVHARALSQQQHPQQSPFRRTQSSRFLHDDTAATTTTTIAKGGNSGPPSAGGSPLILMRGRTLVSSRALGLGAGLGVAVGGGGGGTPVGAGTPGGTGMAESSPVLAELTTFQKYEVPHLLQQQQDAGTPGSAVLPSPSDEFDARWLDGGHGGGDDSAGGGLDPPFVASSFPPLPLPSSSSSSASAPRPLHQPSASVHLPGEPQSADSS